MSFARALIDAPLPIQTSALSLTPIKNPSSPSYGNQPRRWESSTSNQLRLSGENSRLVARQDQAGTHFFVSAGNRSYVLKRNRIPLQPSI